MFVVFLHLKQQDCSLIVHRDFSVETDGLDRSRSGLVTFNWRQRQQTVTFQLGDAHCRASTDCKDRTVCVYG